MTYVTRLSRRRFLGHSALAAAATLPLARALSAATGSSTAIDRDLDAVTGAGKDITLKRAEIKELAASLRGNLLLPGDAGYDSARRVRNAQMNKHPAFVVQPRGAAD